MKRLIICFICITLLICGCQKEVEITEQEYKNQVILKGIKFNNEDTPSSSDVSEAYIKLFEQEYRRSLDSIEYDIETDKFMVDVVNPTSLKVIVKNDVSGFQKDYNNQIQLGISQELIDDYVYSYIKNAIKACDLESVQVEFTLSDDKQSFQDNSSLVKIITNNINELYNTTVHYEQIDNVDTWNIPENTIKVGYGQTIKVHCDKDNVNCFLVINNIIQGDEAKEYVRGLSSVNKDLDFQDDIIVVTYSVMNLSEKSVIFTDKFISVDENGYVLSFDSDEIVGLDSVKKIEPKAETSITNAYVSTNSGSLLWYDSYTANLIRVDLDNN